MDRSGVAIVGATGRMGSLVRELIAGNYGDRLEVAALVSRQNDLEDMADADIVIDFSLPPGTLALIDWLAATDGGPKTLVSGTTGLDQRLMNRLSKLGDTHKVLHATNFSSGIAVLTSILELAAPMLAELGYSPVLTEVHHRHKTDSPSGTALTLAASAAPFTDIPTHSVRAGEVIGRHEFDFYADHECLRLSHEAQDRRVFARGAIDAALWLNNETRKSGFFTMQSYCRERFFRS